MAVKAKLDLTSAYVQTIDGKASPTETTRNGINPANLQALPKVPVATPEDLDRAVAAGKKAFKAWSKVPLDERRKALHAYADAIEGVQNEFRDLLVAEGGKPVCRLIILSACRN
jgi:acyl-CoA reductase-like NAD-dependent aldehyde dehydrogenase